MSDDKRLENLVQLAERLHYDLAKALKLHRNCPDCNYFDERTELCELADERPPARVIARGCARFLNDIPF